MVRGQTLPLGKLFGIPVGLDLSWFLIVAFLTWSLADSWYPANFPDWAPGIYWLMGLVTALSLFGSVLLHELGHALAAMAYHVPVRRIRLLFFGGVAEMGDELPAPWPEMLVAGAGPFVSFVLALLSGMAAFVLWLLRIEPLEPIFGLFAYLGLMNLMLVAFNLIPGFPLDGGRVLRGLLWWLTKNHQQATRIAAGVGRVFGFGFVGLGLFQVVSGSLGDGLWSILIGFFLNGAATAELRAVAFRRVLSSRSVSQHMRESYPSIPADLRLGQLAQSGALGTGWRSFMVYTEDGRIGTLGGAQVTEIVQRDGQARAYALTAGEAMNPLPEAQTVAPDALLWAALKQMEQAGVDRLAVVANGRVMGMIFRSDLLGLLRGLPPVAAGARPSS